MRKKSIFYQLSLGLLVGALLMPPQPVQAQWTVFDPAQYKLQVAKKLESATRWIQTVTFYSEKLTRLKGILDLTEDLVAKQRGAIATMSNIGRTVRGAFQLKNQVEAIVTSRIRALKTIDDRLRNGIFDPEADMRDFEEYLRSSIGRGSQDAVATLERLMRMDNKLKRLQDDLESASARKAWAEGKQTKTQSDLDDELAKLASVRCAPCIVSLNQELGNYEILIAQLESEISRLRSEIKERVKLYNVELEERAKFGQRVQSMNEAWSQFNNSLDEFQRALSRIP
jgi:predicted  nucleic acid-binding Zn-ribbon protein